MKKIRLSLFLFAALALPLSAENIHLLTLGLRGGEMTVLQQSAQNLNNQLGGVGALDLGYIWYAPVPKADLGIRTGLLLGYGASAIGGGFSQQFTNTDYLGNQMDYTTSAQLYARQQMVSAEVPLMMALRAKGFTFNVGLSLQTVLWQHTRQHLYSPKIDAFYPAYNVHVTDELITGQLSADRQADGYAAGLPTAGMGVCTEIGYDFALPKGYLGLQAFFSCSVWNNFHPSDNVVIAVAPVANPVQPVPEVQVSNALPSLCSSVHPLFFGLRLYYAFEWRR